MAQTKDCSATLTPRILIGATVALLVLRAVTGLVATAAPTATNPITAITWRTPADFKAWPPVCEEKLVLYEFRAQWSDPCKQMEKSALANQQVAEIVNNQFMPIRITDITHERGKNPQFITDLEKRYRVFALPTLVVVKEDGGQVGSLVGNCSSLTTYRFLSRAFHNHNIVEDQDFD